MNKSTSYGMRGGICALLISCAACSQDKATPAADEAQAPLSAPSAEKQQTPEIISEVQPSSMSFKEQVEFSGNDLATRLGIEKDKISFSGARPVNWRSSALGCPEPGMNYMQALVPGALIFFRVGNDVHGYHASQGGKPFYCPRDRAEQPVFGQGADLT